MDREPEVIKQEMEQTRAGLAEKLDTLEQQVTETVQGAKEAVTDTVSNVKEAVEETVGTVKETVEETVTSIKETFDLRMQVERHPWGMLGGSVAAGFLVGYLLNRSQPESGNIIPRLSAATSNGRQTKPAETAHYEEAPTAKAPSAFWATFGPEIDRLKGLAIGVALGVARELLTKAVPKAVEQPFCDVMESLTDKLGGEKVQGPILEESAHEPVETTSAV